MGIYNWSMKRASVILFVISAVIFLIGLGQALLALKNTAGDAIIGGEPISVGVMSFLMLLTGTFTALSSAAIPFIGAVAIDRWDRRNS
jgi:uncharacterized membrane protein (DUF485 family)